MLHVLTADGFVVSNHRTKTSAIAAATDYAKDQKQHGGVCSADVWDFDKRYPKGADANNVVGTWINGVTVTWLDQTPTVDVT